MKVAATAFVCQPTYGGGWTCFGSNGDCNETFSSCGCSPSSCAGGSGSSSGCNTCCCNPAIAAQATNYNLALITSAENQLFLNLPNQSPINLGNFNLLNLEESEVFKFSVDIVAQKIDFAIYDNRILNLQVEKNGYVTSLSAAYVRTVTLSYS
jgi:hypothetical protein